MGSVVDKTIMTTRLVVGYFRNFGHLSLEQLTGVKEKRKNQQQSQYQPPQYHHQQQVPMHQPPPTPSQPHSTSTSSRNSPDFNPLRKWLLSKLDQKSIFVANKCIQDLQGEGVSFDDLVEKCKSGMSRMWLSEKMSIYRQKYPMVNMMKIARVISDWCCGQSGGARRADIDRSLQPVYTSLMAFKHFLLKSLPITLEEMGTVTKNKSELEGYAEDYLRGLTYLGFSHYNLKNEYDKGEGRFRTRLWGHLQDVRSQLAPIVSIDALVDLCIKYFRQNF